MLGSKVALMSLHAVLLVQQAGAGSIAVKVIRATNVPQTGDLFTHNDMYVTLSKGVSATGQGGIECGRTSTKTDTADPTWNEVLRCDSCDSNTRMTLALREDGGLNHGNAYGGFTFTVPMPDGQKSGAWSLSGGGLLHYEFDSDSDFCGTEILNTAGDGVAGALGGIVGGGVGLVFLALIGWLVFVKCCKGGTGSSTSDASQKV